MSGFSRDLREAWRGLLRQRALSAAALIMLSVGIAASSAIFAVVQAVVLKMPFDEPDRIVAVRARAGGEVVFATFDHFGQWRKATDVFESVAADTLVLPVLTGDDAALRLQAEALTASMFAVLGVQPALGRMFRDDEPAVAVLSHTFWGTRFNADPAVLGRSILLDGIPTTVVGVMPAGFDGPRSRPGDIWVPLMPRRPAGADRVSVVARLAHGVETTAAQARLEAMPWDPGAKTRWTARLDTAREDFLLAEAMEQVRILGGAVAVVLLMACVNVASLLLGRNISRRRELAVRLALVPPGTRGRDEVRRPRKLRRGATGADGARRPRGDARDDRADRGRAAGGELPQIEPDQPGLRDRRPDEVLRQIRRSRH